MKVTAILKGKIDSNGHQPIQIRINMDARKRYFKPTKIKVQPEQFKDGKVVNHPKAKEYNESIKNLIIQYQAKALDGFEKKIAIPTFYAYFNQKVASLDRKQETLRQYNSQINKLKRYAPVFYLDDVTHEWLNGYKKHLKGKGNTGNTIWSGFKFLKTFIDMAVNDGLIADPFRNYEMPEYNPPQTNYLDKKEVKEIEKFINKAECPPALKEAGTWFLIGCHTGMRISDLKAFDRKKRIIGGRLVFKTQKTGQMVGLPISPKLKALLQSVEYKPLSIHEVIYNRLLKVLAAAVGITKHISSHTARHTAGMLMADAGVSIEVAAEILGHSSTKHTQVYYKISNKRLDMEMKKLKF